MRISIGGRRRLDEVWTSSKKSCWLVVIHLLSFFPMSCIIISNLFCSISLGHLHAHGFGRSFSKTIGVPEWATSDDLSTSPSRLHALQFWTIKSTHAKTKEHSFPEQCLGKQSKFGIVDAAFLCAEPIHNWRLLDVFFVFDTLLSPMSFAAQHKSQSCIP